MAVCVECAQHLEKTLAYGDQIKEKIPGSVDDKVIDFLQENPVATGLAGYGLATLYPEARASYSALKHVLKHRGKAEMMKDLKRTLGPAYGTYLAGALPVAAGYGLAKKYKSSLKEKEKKKAKKGQEKAAAITPEDIKAFAAGAAVAGIPTGLAAYYQHGTKGGRTINDIDEERIRRNVSSRLGQGLGAKAYARAKKTNEFMERHPVGAAVATGGAIGLLSGLLTAVMMKDMGALKKVADDQGEMPLKRTVTTGGPRLAEITEKSDSGPVNYV